MTALLPLLDELNCMGLCSQMVSEVRSMEAEQALAHVQAQLGLYDYSRINGQELAAAALSVEADPAAATLVFDVLAASGEDFRLANRCAASALHGLETSYRDFIRG